MTQVTHAGVAELADAADSKSAALIAEVRVTRSFPLLGGWI